MFRLNVDPLRNDRGVLSVAPGRRELIRTAHFSAVKTLEDFNFDYLPSPRRDVLAHFAARTSQALPFADLGR